MTRRKISQFLAAFLSLLWLAAFFLVVKFIVDMPGPLDSERLAMLCAALAAWCGTVLAVMVAVDG
jgi:hypothetical protein